MGDESPPSDEEIIRRLQGHLKPYVLDDVPLPAWARQTSPVLGVLWLVGQALLLALVWTVLAWIPLSIVALYLLSLVQSMVHAAILPPTTYQWIFTLLLVGGYLGLLWKVLRAAQRQEKAAVVEDVLLSRAGGCSSYRNFLFILWRLLLLPGMAGFAHFSGQRSSGAAFDSLLTNARLCFLLAEAPDALSLEGLWKQFDARFPGVFPDSEAGKVFLAGALRNLLQEGLVVDRRDDGLSLHKATIYGPSPRLRALVARCRGQTALVGGGAEGGAVPPSLRCGDPPSDASSAPRR
jgi:hypothetical protein